MTEIEADRAVKQQVDLPGSCRQQAADSLAHVLLSVWPDNVWLPMPFDTRILSHNRYGGTIPRDR